MRYAGTAERAGDLYGTRSIMNEARGMFQGLRVSHTRVARSRNTDDKSCFPSLPAGRRERVHAAHAAADGDADHAVQRQAGAGEVPVHGRLTGAFRFERFALSTHWDDPAFVRSQDEALGYQAAFKRAPPMEVIVFVVGGSTYEESK